MTTAIVPVEAARTLARDDGEWSVEHMVAQAKKIQECMNAVMVDGEHYGVIPGVKGVDGKPPKKTLLKPGAEKLCLMFRLCPEYETLRAEQSPTLVSYAVRCILTHIPTGNRIATGLGSCNSRENKYVRQAPKRCPQCGGEFLIAGKPEYEKDPAYKGGMLCYQKKGGCGAKFKPGDEAIEKQPTGIADPSDLDNTILKMACKRALVAAVLNGTAASDCFTQDLEDLTEKAAEYTPPVKEAAPAEGKDGATTATVPTTLSTNTVESGVPTQTTTTPTATTINLHDHQWDKKTGKCACGEYRNASFVPAKDGRITAEQIQLIHVLRAEYGGLTEEKYREIVAVYRDEKGLPCVGDDGKGTSKKLSAFQAAHLIQRFRRKIATQGKRASDSPDVGAVVPDIAPRPNLQELLGKAMDTDDADAWVHATFGKHHIQELDRPEVEAAFALLAAWGDDTKYSETETKLRARGVVR